MAQQHNFLQLTLISLTLLGWGAMPSLASPAQGESRAAAPDPVAHPTPRALPLGATETPGLPINGPLATPGTDSPAPADPISNPDLAPENYLTAAAALTLPTTPGLSATSTIAPSDTLSRPQPARADLTLGAMEGDLPRERGRQGDWVAQDIDGDPELGVIQVRSLVEDTDLGVLRIREQLEIPTQVAQPPRPNIGFLTGRLAIANSDNILLAFNDVGGVTGDTFLRPSLAFAVYPVLGPQTVFIGTADLGLQRYSSQSSLNYDDLRFRVGLRQGLTPRSYGQLIFTYQELFRPGGNRGRFFKNSSVGLTLGRRDPITPRLALDSFYQIQYNGAQSQNETLSGPVSNDFSRFFQSAGAYLGYDITPRVQTGISYQINLIDYTTQDRYDAFQQVLGQVAYRLSPAVRLSIYGGVSFGRSSEPRVRFNDTFFGAAIDATIPLF